MESGAKIAERIDEALREIAVLFIALAPLDVFLGEARSHAVRNGLILVGVGLMIFVIALFVERNGSVDDFLIVMSAVVFVCLSGAAYTLWLLRKRDSKSDRKP